MHNWRKSKRNERNANRTKTVCRRFHDGDFHNYSNDFAHKLNPDFQHISSSIRKI